MAGEITQEAITLALGGAGIGAGGAVIAQIVAATFTGRRENRRFKWEKRQTFRDDGPPTGDYYNELSGRYRAVVGELEPLMQSSLGLDAKGNINDK